MNRSEFLKWLAATPFINFLEFDIKNGEEIFEPINEEAEQNINDLWEAMQNQKPIKLFGLEFMLTECELDYGIESLFGMGAGRRVNLKLVSFLEFENAGKDD